MKVAHVALWTRDLNSAACFWRNYFDAHIGEEYQSSRRAGFASLFVTLPKSGDKVELMTGPWLLAEGPAETVGWHHVAIDLGNQRAVDEMADRCERDGCLVSRPRLTGDGFYEAVIQMTDGTPIEITG